MNSFQKMADFAIFSLHSENRAEMSEPEAENLDDSLDDSESQSGTVPDSGVSEVGSQVEMSKYSISKRVIGHFKSRDLFPIS